jgi:hypothetical protein
MLMAAERKDLADRRYRAVPVDTVHFSLMSPVRLSAPICIPVSNVLLERGPKGAFGTGCTWVTLAERSQARACASSPIKKPLMVRAAVSCQKSFTSNGSPVRTAARSALSKRTRPRSRKRCIVPPVNMSGIVTCHQAAHPESDVRVPTVGRIRVAKASAADTDGADRSYPSRRRSRIVLPPCSVRHPLAE